MAYLIPALEWDEQEITGNTTLDDPTITNISDTSALATGQVVYGPGIPFNARILSKGADSITLDLNATATAEDISISVFKRFDFVYPASSDDGEQLVANQSVTTSLAGNQQTVTNFIEAIRKLTFGFVTKTDRDLLRDNFYTSWALLGKPFRYLEDKEENAHVIYENDINRYKQKRQIKKHPDFLYELEFNFRRVI